MAYPAIIKPYEDLDAIKDVLEITDTSFDEALTQYLMASSDEIDRYVSKYHQRTFVTDASTTAATTRTYLGHRSPVLEIDDALAVSTVLVNNVQIDNTPNTQWSSRPLNLTEIEPCYTHLVRVSPIQYGQEIPWTVLISSIYYLGIYTQMMLQSLSVTQVTVQVTANWGYSTTLPWDVRQACQIMTARMWQRRLSRFGNEKGAATPAGVGLVQMPKPVIDEDCKLLLDPYVRQPVAGPHKRIRVHS